MITRIAAVEIPVADLAVSLDWYTQVLGLEAFAGADESATEVLIGFPGSAAETSRIHLVQTNAADRLGFHNTNHGYTQSIVDFYAEDLAVFHRHLTSHGVRTNRESVDLAAGEQSGFGFLDPDGNSLGATNVAF
jgi:catechol 2,3-dioxygenase-like lactoylglutathione lyase family enzyme